MQHQLSNSNASTNIGRVKSIAAVDRASARLARLAEIEATQAMQRKQARNFSNMKPEASERIRLVETALRTAAQASAPRASCKSRHGDQQLSGRARSAGAQRFGTSRIFALISLALMLPSLVFAAVWLNVLHWPLAAMSQQRPFMPSPVLTAPAFLEATAGESIFLPIALDGTDGVPADSTLAVTGLPQGSTLSNGRPFGDTGWKLEPDEIGDLQLVLPSSAGGQAKLTIQLMVPDATVVAYAETLLQVATASQVSLPRNAEHTKDAPLAPANQEPTLFGMSVLEVSPESADAQLAHETPEGQPDGVREAKPSAAGTEQEVKPVTSPQIADAQGTVEGTEGQLGQGLPAAKPLPPRVAQPERRAAAKNTIINVGTDEVKTSVFVNLRQGPSPSAGVVRVVAKGTKLRVVARKGRWLQVTNPATSEEGWIYGGNANRSRTTKASAPSEPSQATQRQSDSIWPSFLRRLASR